jgi:hypothetical protein
MGTKTLLLIRTTRPDQSVCAFANHLRDASRARVLLLIDNRRGAPIEAQEDWLVLDKASYRSLDLYCPADVGWRCGDYGLYIAKRKFPDAHYFWMMEDDLRIDGVMSSFFDHFASRPEIDFLTTRLRRASHEWHWSSHSLARDVANYACLFGITRSSARAIETFYRKRRRHSRQINRMLLWPNDESFCATTATANGLAVKDLNDCGQTFYDDEGYSLTGASKRLGSPNAPPRLLHPVYDEVVAARRMLSTQRYSEGNSRAFRIRRALARRLNAVSSW